MSEEPNAEPIAQPNAPEPYPFWGYSDLVLFAGLTIPCMLMGIGVVKVVLRIFHLHPAVRAAEVLPEQFLGYAFLFGALLGMFQLQYQRPFWSSLAWNAPQLPLFSIVIAGIAAAFCVARAGTLIQVPQGVNPMKEFLADRTSLLLVAVFGVSVGPLCEELAFRGFLQPVLVRSMGPIPGILAAAVPFGLLHLPEYGYSWRHVLLITLAGAAFGWMRQATGSTRASTIMHAAYNGLFFFALLSQGRLVGQASRPVEASEARHLRPQAFVKIGVLERLALSTGSR